MLNVRALQAALQFWEQHNFPDTTDLSRLAIVTEEVGELAHCILKQLQNIRPESSGDDKMKDAIGDVFVTLCTLSSGRGWDLADIIEEVSARVLARDWVADRAARAAANG